MKTLDIFLQKDNKTLKKRKRLEEDRIKRFNSFLERAKEVHGDKYGYDEVDYINANTKVQIYCKEHNGYFWQTPHDHLSGRGCRMCSYKHRGDSSRLSIKEFLDRAISVHGDKYDYSKVDYVNNRIKVQIYCKEHEEYFWQRPSDHMRGQGCPKCGVNCYIASRMLGVDEFIRRSRIVHGDKYDYSKVKYYNNGTKVEIICPEHGSFWQVPVNHFSGQGCPKCGIEKRKLSIPKTFATRRKNGTLSSSILQENLQTVLFSIFGESDVEIEYNEDERYPYHCDFYIKSEDLFIELNGYYAHNDHWFDETDENDIQQLEEWKRRDVSDDYGSYSNTIETWTVRDVEKREHARKNNLNYVVFWDGKRNDNGLTHEIESWIAEGCPIRKDWK